jgi:hypothetical protein
MLTEQILRDYPLLVKALTGVPAETFWQIIDAMEAQYPDYQRQRYTHDERQRAVGGGRTCDLPLVIRVTMLVFYLRTHIPQTLAAVLCGGTQSDVSRDLRRLLPLLIEVLPAPVVWDIVDEPQPEPGTEPQPEPGIEPQPEPGTRPQPEPGTRPQPEPGTRPQPEPGIEPQPEPGIEPQPLDRITSPHILIDATEQEVARPQDHATRKRYYSGKQKEFTRKTQVVTDDDHHIIAISVAVPGTLHDKKLCDRLHTLERLPDGADVKLDKGYQGVAAQVETVTVRDATTGQAQQVACLTVQTPIKKPRGGELTDAQKAYNRTINTVRVRAEHCIGWAKNWAILATQFRCSHAIYTSVMQAVCGLVNQQTQRWQEAKQAEAAYCA